MAWEWNWKFCFTIGSCTFGSNRVCNIKLLCPGPSWSQSLEADCWVALLECRRAIGNWLQLYLFDVLSCLSLAAWHHYRSTSRNNHHLASGNHLHGSSIGTKKKKGPRRIANGHTSTSGMVITQKPLMLQYLKTHKDETLEAGRLDLICWLLLEVHLLLPVSNTTLDFILSAYYDLYNDTT